MIPIFNSAVKEFNIYPDYQCMLKQDYMELKLYNDLLKLIIKLDALLSK